MTLATTKVFVQWLHLQGQPLELSLNYLTAPYLDNSSLIQIPLLMDATIQYGI